jgi:hypothetical protein
MLPPYVQSAGIVFRKLPHGNLVTCFILEFKSHLNDVSRIATRRCDACTVSAFSGNSLMTRIRTPGSDPGGGEILCLLPCALWHATTFLSCGYGGVLSQV